MAREREAQVVQQHPTSDPAAFMSGLADNWVHAIERLCRFFIKVDLELRSRENRRLNKEDAEAVQNRMHDFIQSEIQNLKMTLMSKFKARGLEESKIHAFLPTLDGKAQNLRDCSNTEILNRIKGYNGL